MFILDSLNDMNVLQRLSCAQAVETTSAAQEYSVNALIDAKENFSKNKFKYVEQKAQLGFMQSLQEENPFEQLQNSQDGKQRE